MFPGIPERQRSVQAVPGHYELAFDVAKVNPPVAFAVGRVKASSGRSLR